MPSENAVNFVLRARPLSVTPRPQSRGVLAASLILNPNPQFPMLPCGILNLNKPAGMTSRQAVNSLNG